jgi:hypothetical protein
VGKTYHYEEDKPSRDKEVLKQARRDRVKSRRIQEDKPPRNREKPQEEEEKDLNW